MTGSKCSWPVTLILHANEATAQSLPLVTVTAHTELQQIEDTAHTQARQLFLKPCAITYNISPLLLPLLGSCMTPVGMKNEAAKHPRDGIIFFILAQNRQSFRTGELCSRCSSVYQTPSDIEVIPEDGVFSEQRDVSRSNFKPFFFSLTIKGMGGKSGKISLQGPQE